MRLLLSLASINLHSSLFVLSPSTVVAVPSATYLESSGQDSVSRAHLPESPILPYTNAANQQASVIDTIWQYFYPDASKDRLRSIGAIKDTLHLNAQYADQLLLRFNVSTKDEAAALAEAADILFLDVWGHASDWVDIRLAHHVLPSLLGLLPKSLQTSHTQLMTGNDLVRAIADTYPPPPRSRHERIYKVGQNTFKPAKRIIDDDSPGVFFDNYRPLSVILPWMRLLESLFSTHARVITVGETHDGQPIQALRLGALQDTPDELKEPRKTVLITAGSHAREWISTSTVNYVANAITSSYGHDKIATRLLDEMDWIFVPTLNPDGYQYTWEADRLWRKTRQPTSLRFCRGLDLDRTYPFEWSGNMTTLENPCSESYAGAEPLGAPESRSFAKWAHDEIDSGNTTFVALLDLHSYSEQILYPYSYSCDATVPNLEDLAELGQGLAKAIRASSKTHESYRVMSACEGNVNVAGMEAGGGSMLDWFYHELGVKRSFQIKLRDKGSYGFLLPRDYIVPTGIELLNGVRYLGMTLIGAGPWSIDDDEGHAGFGRDAQQPLM